MKNTHLKILHLEDNPYDAELIGISLSEYFPNSTIHHVSNKSDYIMALNKGDFDILLSDYNVPEFLGTESLSLVQEYRGLVPFIYVTGALGESIAIEVLKAGATDYVLKDGLEKLPYAIERAYKEVKREKENLLYLKQLALKDDAIENAGIGVLIMEPKNDSIVYANKFIEKITGYPEIELIGNSMAMFQGKETQEDSIKAIENAFSNILTFNEVMLFYRKDGSTFWADVNISPVKDLDEKLSSFTLVLKDVTDQKRLEAEIIKSNRLFEEVQDIARIGLWSYDPKADQVHLSTEVVRILGEVDAISYSMIEAVKLIHKDYRELFEKSIKKAMLWRTTWDIDLLLHDIEGGEKWVRQIGYPILKDNKVVLVRGLLMDIHDKKMAEKQAKQSLEFSDLIFNSVNDLICLHAPNGNFLKVSPSIETITGYTFEDLEGKRPYHFMHPEDQENLFKGETHPLMSPERFNVQTEYRFKHKDGHYLWFLTNPVPVYNDEGNIEQIVTSTVDITESKKKNLELEKEHRAAIKYQCMLLSTQINPHFIFNSLNAVQYYILDQNVEPAIHFISNFSTLMRGVLANSMRNYISIKDEINWLTRYMDLEKARFSDKFDYEISISDAMDIEYDMIPTMLLQPFVENAIIHGMGPLKSGGVIKLNFTKENGLIICIVDDNGTGREKAGEMRKLREENARHRSYGVKITRTKIELLNELENGGFDYSVIDKKNKDGSSTGTQVVITYPANIG